MNVRRYQESSLMLELLTTILINLTTSKLSELLHNITGIIMIIPHQELLYRLLLQLLFLTQQAQRRNGRS